MPTVGSAPDEQTAAAQAAKAIADPRAEGAPLSGPGIYLDGGDGDDVVIVHGGQTLPVTVKGSAGQDSIEVLDARPGAPRRDDGDELPWAALLIAAVVVVCVIGSLGWRALSRHH